jgi:type II secretory pathway pseudopilin PulG
MNTRPAPRSPRQSGYTLITTLVLTGITTMVLAATLSRTYTVIRLNDRENAYLMANTAAEAATEKVISQMMVDFATGGNVTLSNNITHYRTGLLPTSTESPYWTNFQFSDAQGNTNATYVACTTTNPNPPYVALAQQYPGLNAFALNYRVISNVKYTNSGYTFTSACQQDLQMAEIPVFQFAIFYNTPLEFSDCAPLTVNGRVQCNSNIDVGTVSSGSLTFNYMVTASGTISNPPMAGYSQSQWTGPITYNGTPSPGYGTGEPVLTLPIGTNNTPAAVRQIIYPPPAGESPTNPVSPLRYYNEADMVITITNPVAVASTNTPIAASNYSVMISIKNSMYDSSPTNIYLGTNVSKGTNVVNWANTGISNWLSTNVTFYDQRENRTCQVAQIDIGKLGTWIGYNSGTGAATNAWCSSKWSGGAHFNGIIYVQDVRNTNATYMDCVRVCDGQAITNGFAAYGLTLATQNPLYVMGLYNCPTSTNIGSTNTIGTMPCAFVSDAITILSPNWTNSTDASSFSTTMPAAASDTVNAAMIAGNVLSTDSSATGFSGGVHNLTRLLDRRRVSSPLT